MADRYDAVGDEAEFEPGSRGRVLRNRLGIVLVRDMKLAESQALILAQRTAVDRITQAHRFTAQDVCDLHAMWLSEIYAWAGEYRSVNLSKGGFPFATATRVQDLMRNLEHTALAEYTPCNLAKSTELPLALAIVHSELILIHPFRDGNGRVARLLALLMALQAGLPPLDFSPLDGRGKAAYIVAIHAAMDHDYQLMTDCFSRVIERTWKGVAPGAASSSTR